MSWCKAYLGFLKDANIFCAGVAPPNSEGKSNDALPIATSNIAQHAAKGTPLVDLEDETEIDAPDDAAGEESCKDLTAQDEVEEARTAKKSAEPKASASKRKSDAHDGIEGNSTKGTRTTKSKLVNAWDPTANKESMDKLSSEIKLRVDTFEKAVDDDFDNVPSFDHVPDKYEGMPRVILRASDVTNLSGQDFFLYVKQDLELFQKLANAEELDKAVLAEMVEKVLTRWEKLFSTHIIEGMEKMAEALKELRALLVGTDATLPSPDIDGVSAYKGRVEETLKEAAAIQEAIRSILSQFDASEAIAQKKRDALATTRKQQEKKIADLRASLKLAEEKLVETQTQETELEAFFKDSGITRQDCYNLSINVKKTADRGELAKAEAEKHIEYAGENSKSSQPKPVRSLLAYMQSSSCEE